MHVFAPYFKATYDEGYGFQSTEVAHVLCHVMSVYTRMPSAEVKEVFASPDYHHLWSDQWQDEMEKLLHCCDGSGESMAQLVGWKTKDHEFDSQPGKPEGTAWALGKLLNQHCLSVW